MIRENDIIQVMTGRCDDEDLNDWIIEHGHPLIRITQVEDDNLWGEVFPSGEDVPYHMEMRDVEFYCRFEDTAQHYIDVLKQLPPQTIISVEDMDGNVAIYPECSMSINLDVDTPYAELLLPIYIKKLSIEPDEEKNVFINNGEILDNEN